MIDFVYGLTFFVMGVVCYLAGRAFRSSRLALAQALPVLSGFGILVGLAVWGVVFIPLQAAYLRAPWLDGLRAVQSAVLIAGHACLVAFGVKLLSRWYSLQLAAAGAALLGTVTYAGALLILENGPHLFAAYGLGLPGAVLSAWGVLLQRRELLRFYPGPARSLLVAAWAFILSVPLGPLALPTAGQSPTQLWGVPMEAFLSVGGFLLAWSLFASLETLRLENSRRLERAERREALLEGRYHLAKELNDGVIQDLFAVGMMMGAAAWDLPETARAPLTAAERQLQLAVERMRSYIMDLDPADWSEPDLAVGIHRLVDEFRANSLIPATVEVEGAPVLPAGHVRELYTVLHEALSNVRRHSGAREVRVAVHSVGPELILRIEDDGVGCDPNRARGAGLERMYRSAAALDGRLLIEPGAGGGTRVLLQLPSASMVS